MGSSAIENRKQYAAALVELCKWILLIVVIQGALTYAPAQAERAVFENPSRARGDFREILRSPHSAEV